MAIPQLPQPSQYIGLAERRTRLPTSARTAFRTFGLNLIVVENVIWLVGMTVGC